MRVDVLALDHVFDLGLSAVLDVFETANELIEASALTMPRFEVRTVGVRKVVKTSHGLRVPVQAAGSRRPDCVVVPAIGFKMPEPLVAALARPDIRDATACLQQYASGSATMTAACIGTFVMAESGLLDDQRATTTWWLAPLFRHSPAGSRWMMPRSPLARASERSHATWSASSASHRSRTSRRCAWSVPCIS